tara:strand:+ start:3091 stop:4644 length:1554 start_codon:yes stop_codon:yes gene_type:complete
MLILKMPPTKTIVIPDKFDNDYLTDFYRFLISIFQSLIPNLQVVKSSEFQPHHTLELVVIVSLSHWPEEDMLKIERLHESTCVVTWYDDYIWISETARCLNVRLFDRAQCIIHSSKDTYLDMWSKYKDKSFWLPFFAAPYFYKEFNCDPRPRCLLSGSRSKEYYPVRHMIANSQSPHVDVLNHPGYMTQGTGVRENYADLVYSYLCCVADGGITYNSCKYKITGQERKFDRHIDDYLLEMMGEQQFLKFKQKSQMVLKFFEIPACSSLLIVVNPTVDLEEIGYKDGINFIATSTDRAIDVIADCCENPNKYKEIRYAGWLLSKQFDMVQREAQLKIILEGVGIQTRHTLTRLGKRDFHRRSDFNVRTYHSVEEWEMLKRIYNNIKHMAAVPKMLFPEKSVVLIENIEGEQLKSAKVSDVHKLKFLEFLWEMNRLGYIHRDLHCENVIISGNEIFVIDWDFVTEQRCNILDSYDLTGRGFSPHLTDNCHIFKSFPQLNARSVTNLLGIELEDFHEAHN